MDEPLALLIYGIVSSTPAVLKSKPRADEATPIEEFFIAGEDGAILAAEGDIGSGVITHEGVGVGMLTMVIMSEAGSQRTFLNKAREILQQIERKRRVNGEKDGVEVPHAGFPMAGLLNIAVVSDMGVVVGEAGCDVVGC